MKKLFVLASILAALMGPAAAAQTDPHHPGQSQGTQPEKVPTGQGMMSGQAMMMNCPMMGMMGPGGPHTEGRLAFLKTELKVTDAQEKAWTAYADAVRAIDQKRASGGGMMGMGSGMKGGQGVMGQGMMGGGMMQQGAAMSAPEALEKRAQHLQTHLENLKDLQAATKKLYRALDETQKKTADEVLAMPCCIGAM